MFILLIKFVSGCSLLNKSFEVISSLITAYPVAALSCQRRYGSPLRSTAFSSCGSTSSFSTFTRTKSPRFTWNPTHAFPLRSYGAVRCTSIEVVPTRTATLHGLTRGKKRSEEKQQRSYQACHSRGS